MAEHAVARMMRHRGEVRVVVDVVETGIAYPCLTLLHRYVAVERGQEKHGDKHCHEYPCRRLSLVAIPHCRLLVATMYNQRCTFCGIFFSLCKVKDNNPKRRGSCLKRDLSGVRKF